MFYLFLNISPGKVWLLKLLSNVIIALFLPEINCLCESSKEDGGPEKVISSLLSSGLRNDFDLFFSFYFWFSSHLQWCSELLLIQCSRVTWVGDYLKPGLETRFPACKPCAQSMEPTPRTLEYIFNSYRPRWCYQAGHPRSTPPSYI